MGDHDFQQAPVHAVQTYLVDVHTPQGFGSLFGGDDVVAAHHGKIPHATQEAVGDARCTAGAAAYLLRTVRRDGDAEDVCRAQHHPGQFGRGVELQLRKDAEAPAQGRGDQAHARGGPHQGERLQVDLDRAGRRALPDDQIQLEVFHGRIQHFLHSDGHAVDLVHEEDVVTGQIGQDGGQIAAALQYRARGADQVDAQLGSHDLGQGRLAQTGIAVKERMIQRAAAFTGRAQVHAQIGAQFFLTDEIIQAARPHALFQRSGAQAGVFRTGRGYGRVLFRRGIPVIIAEKAGCGGRGRFLCHDVQSVRICLLHRPGLRGEHSRKRKRRSTDDRAPAP